MEKVFDCGIIILKKRDFAQTVKKILFVVYVIKKINQIKEFEPNLNESKRQLANKS